MSRITNEEAKKRHVRELTNARVKRYLEAHKMITFGTKIDEDHYREITSALKERGITQKQFIESAIDQFLKEGK